MKRIIVSGAFDDLRFDDFRFLEEASQLGNVHVMLWSDRAVESATGKPPKFPFAEREYFVRAIRYVASVEYLPGDGNTDVLPQSAGVAEQVWAVRPSDDTPARRQWAASAGVEYRIITDSLDAAPPTPQTPDNPPSTRKKVLVTGSFDWFHSGHVRFFEEVSEIGDLYVVVGHDENIGLLKGPGHPLFPAAQRRYITGSIRFVKLALISTGNGWLDAEPECRAIRPDIYAVNEDGDRPEKARFCEQNGIEYRVLKRLPKAGLPRRQSTMLRGF